jgi:glycosyltransferase involved in cell wall biosynthesis
VVRVGQPRCAVQAAQGERRHRRCAQPRRHSLHAAPGLSGEHAHRLSETIADHIQYADYALATSPGVDRDLRGLAERFLGRSIATRVIKLGADLLEPGLADVHEAFAAACPALAALRFLLTVGTVEPRKNYALLLRAFDRLEAKDAGLVIVGRKGWMADDVLAALTRHPEFGKRLFWYETLDDEALVTLYSHAYASVLPSQYEGYGLPVVEAVSQGCAIVVSDAGSLPHVAAGAAEIFPRENGEALFAILDRFYRDPGYHAELRQRGGLPTDLAAQGR